MDNLQQLCEFAHAKYQKNQKTNAQKSLMQLFIQQHKEASIVSGEKMLERLSSSLIKVDEGFNNWEELRRQTFQMQFYIEFNWQVQKVYQNDTNLQLIHKLYEELISLSIYTELGSVFILKAATTLLKFKQNQYDVLDQFLSFKSLLKRVVLSTYDSVNNVNDVTDRISGEIKTQYKSIFTSLEVFGLWAKEKRPTQLRSTIDQVTQQIIKFIYFDSNSQLEFLDSLKDLSEDQQYKYKFSQPFAQKLFQDIRQVMFAWIVSTFNLVEGTQQSFKQLFCNIYGTSPQGQHKDLELLPQECIKIIEFIHINSKINLNDELFSSEKFWRDLQTSMNSFGDLTNSKICVHLLTSILTAIHETKPNEQVQSILKMFRLFSDLYITLDSFGTHLTKQVWSNVDEFLQKNKFQSDNLVVKNLMTLRPLSILINKALNHNNDKTIKNCFKILFKKKIDFELHQDLVLNQIMPMLNSSILYTDSPLEVDSKFYVLVTLFFETNLKTVGDEVYSQYIHTMVIQLMKHIKFQHSITAFGVLFVHLTRKSTALKDDDVIQLSRYVSANVMNLNLRKRVQLYNGMLAILTRNSDWQNIRVSSFLCLLDSFTIESLKWKTTSDMQQILDESELAYFTNSIQFRKKLIFIFQNCAGGFQSEIQELQGTIIKQIQQADSYSAHVGDLKVIVLMYLVTNDINIILPFFEQLSGIYSNSYKSTFSIILAIQSISYILEHTYEDHNQEDRKTIYKVFDGYSSEIFGFLTIFLSQLEELPVVLDQQEILTKFINQVWRVGLQNDIMKETGQLSQQMSKFVGFLFKSTYDNIETYPDYIGLSLFILNKIYHQSRKNIARSKQRGEKTFFVEELLIKHGLVTIGRLQKLSMPRSVKNQLLHFLCRVMSLFREIGLRPVEYQQQLDMIFDDALNFADQFNAYDSVTLYQTLRLVYAPEVIEKMKGFNQEQIEVQKKEIKELALQSFDSMMGVFGTHTQLKEMLEFVNFAVSPIWFENDSLPIVVSEIIHSLFKNKVKSWILIRKIINNLVICLTKYPHHIYTFKNVFIKIIKANEPRGYDSSIVLSTSEQYVPHANKLKSKLDVKGELFGAYPRLQVFALIDWICKSASENSTDCNHELKHVDWKPIYKQLIQFVVDLLRQAQHKKYVTGYMEYNKYFRIRLHHWQLVCCMKKILNKAPLSQLMPPQELNTFLIELELLIWGAFQQQNHPMVRQYMEVMIVAMTDQYPEIWLPRVLSVLSDKVIKTNIMIPMVFIGCVHMRHYSGEDNIPLFNKIFPMVSSNVAYIRSLAQTSCLYYIKKNHILLQNDSIKEFVVYFETNKECVKIIRNIELTISRYEKLLSGYDLDGLLTLQFDSFGETIHSSIIDAIKDTCIQTISAIKEEDGLDEFKPPAWFTYVEQNQKNVDMQDLKEAEAYNFQRKIDFIMDSFSLFQSFRPRQVVGDLIVVATLLEKVPNFGHLTRTCEIFGARELVFPTRKILDDEQYQAVSVTAEKHIPILEVKEAYLMNYLLLKKGQGYKLIGLEQTSQSKNIESFEFPEKTILLLGREKTGIPIEYIEIMDVCVEIPQFGVIRSLNVHISAVICVWQYVKQQMFRK